MAATLTASKNPVYVTAGSSNKTTISWNTDGNFNATIYRDSNTFVPVGGTPDVFATIKAGGPRTGSRDQVIVLGAGDVYTFTLRRDVPNTLLAVVTVTVKDFEQMLVASAVRSLESERKIHPPQGIRDLRVEPSIDTVRVFFRTVYPTIPLIEVETLDGQHVGRVIPFLSGLQTGHDTIVGLADPLPQDETLRLRITTPGQPSPRTGKPARDVVRTVEFKTGARLIWVTFDRLQVRADGDSGNKGDFRFGFEAGDPSDGRYYGVGVYKEDIPATDPKDNVWRALNFSRTIGYVKHEVNVIVQGLDDDQNIFEGGFGYPALRGEVDYYSPGPPFVGSSYNASESAEWTTVGDSINVRNLEPPGSTAVIPFRLNTGDFKVAFTVEGQVRAFMRVGQGYIEMTKNMATGVPNTMGVARQAGAFARASGKQRGIGANIAIAADGAVWMKSFVPNAVSEHRVDWQWAAPPPGGPVTLLLDREERPVLLALDGQGEAMAWQGHSQAGAWIRLGQRFIGAIVAVEGREGCLDLFGVDREGVVWCRALDPHRPGLGEWRQIGGGISGDLVAVPHEAETDLFAIDREGQIAHARYRGGDAEASWQCIGGPFAEWFSVHPLTEELGGLLISALTAERVLHVLHWYDFPAGQPNRLWQEKGPIDTIMPMQPIKTSLPSAPGTDEPHDAAVSAE
jgi:hypothetical protein